MITREHARCGLQACIGSRAVSQGLQFLKTLKLLRIYAAFFFMKPGTSPRALRSCATRLLAILRRRAVKASLCDAMAAATFGGSASLVTVEFSSMH